MKSFDYCKNCMFDGYCDLQKRNNAENCDAKNGMITIEEARKAVFDKLIKRDKNN